MSNLKLYLFGPPRLEQDGEIVHIARRKATALLAYLVMTQQRHSRDWLATLFWPAYNRREGRADLSRTLTVLNKALGQDWLVADRDTVTPNPETDLWVDVMRCRHLLDACRTHGHPDNMVCAVCLTLLADAVALCQAGFLAGFTLADSPAFDEWQLFQTETLRRELTVALDRLSQGYSAQGDWERAILYARRWVDVEPLHEPAHRCLMRLYAHSGKRTAALTQFETCRQMLEKELEVEPSQETQSLYEQIRLGMIAIPAHDASDLTDRVVRLPSFLEGSDVSVTGERPVFVARERELARLEEDFQAALGDGGRIVFVSGEAGRGKTALLHEFARRAQATQSDLIVATGDCSAYAGLGDPYLPFRDVMSMLTGEVEAKWAAGLITRAQALRLWSLLPQTVQALVETGSDLIEVFVSGAALVQRAVARGLGDTAQLQQLQTLIQQIQAGTEALEQRQLFEQYTQVLHSLATRQPMLVLLDDLQWADGASINLLFHLGRRLAGSRILVLGAYRPSELTLGQPGSALTTHDRPHPLKLVLHEFTRQLGDIQIDLSQTTPAEGRGLVDGLLDSEPNRLGERFRAAFFDRTKGHPLFTVELLRNMQERGDLIQDQTGRWIEGPALRWDALPARVEAVIEQRLDRLEAPLKEMLAVSSIEGEVFTAQIVARLQGINERTLLRQLSQELERRHRLVHEREEVSVGQQRLAQYQFRHVLFQQYLYDSFSLGERRLLHGQIAALLEEIYAGHTERAAVQLARHYVEAGKGEKAIDYLVEAGDQARGLYAYQAAIDYYQQALVFLKRSDDYENTARTLMKLGLSYHMDLDFQRAGQSYDEGFTLWQQISKSKSASLPAPSPHPLRAHWPGSVTLDPALADEVVSLSLIDQLFSSLVEHSPEMDVVPAIAHNWEVLDQGRIYLFHLRHDVRWSDGAPVTAGDFEYAWKRVLDPDTNAPAAPLLYDIRGARAYHQGEISTPDQVGVRAVDPLTLRVELEGPTGYFPHLLAFFITYPVPRHVVEVCGQAWTNVENMVTNGPFKLHAWQRSEWMVLTRNPDYHGQFSGNIDRVELSFTADSSIPLQMFEADKLDILSHFTLRKIPTQQQDWVRLRYANDLVSAPGLYTNFMGFDTSRPPFSDPRVRQAFVLATDRAVLVAARRSNELPATGGFVPPGMPGHSPGIGLPYDPEQARQRLSAAGYAQGHGFPIVDAFAAQGHAPFCASLRTQWQQNLGVDVAWKMLDSPQYANKLAHKAVHLYIHGFIADFPDPVNFLHMNNPIRRGQWHNDNFVALIESARRETEHQQRMKLYGQADKILMEEAAIMPMAYGHKHILVKPWVKKYPISAFKFWFWKDVVIEPH